MCVEISSINCNWKTEREIKKYKLFLHLSKGISRESFIALTRCHDYWILVLFFEGICFTEEEDSKWMNHAWRRTNETMFRLINSRDSIRPSLEDGFDGRTRWCLQIFTLQLNCFTQNKFIESTSPLGSSDEKRKWFCFRNLITLAEAEAWFPIDVWQLSR